MDVLSDAPAAEPVAEPSAEPQVLAEPPAPPAQPAAPKPAAAAPKPAARPAPRAAGAAPEIPDSVIGVPEDEETPPAAEGDDKGTPPETDSDEETPPEIERGSVKGKNAWSKIKTEKKALKMELDQVKAELARLKDPSTKPPEMQELINLKQQLQEAENRIGQLDITQSSSFKARFDIPIERTIGRCAAILQRQGFSPEQAKDLANRMVDAAPEDLTGLVQDQPVPVQGALYNLASEVAQMRQDRSEAISNWKQTRLALSETERRTQEITLAENIDRDTGEAVSQALKEGNFMYSLTGGKSPEWDESVVARVETVKGILKTSTNAELVKYVVEGLTAKPLRDLLLRERQRVAQLTKELQSRQALRPGFRGAGDVPPPEAPGSDRAKPAGIGSTIDTLFG